MISIALTGGIACGKSAVSYFMRKKFKAATLDIDDITHQLLMPGNVLFELYLKHFGQDILNLNGTINRRIVADIIFNDINERLWINSCSHSILLNHARDFLVDCHASGTRFALVEVPLLFQCGWQNLFDRTWLVIIPRNLQLQRLCARDKLNPIQAAARLEAQSDFNQFRNAVDLLIDNQNFGQSKRTIINHLR